MWLQPWRVSGTTSVNAKCMLPNRRSAAEMGAPTSLGVAFFSDLGSVVLPSYLVSVCQTDENVSRIGFLSF